MGKPGGFFKKLKAKQKRQTSHRQRGTKGASKEDRRIKHNERVELYAARREADELAAVSSSSEDEVSTDEEFEVRKEEKKLRKLRSMLGVNNAKATRKRTRASSDSSVSQDEEDDIVSDSDDNQALSNSNKAQQGKKALRKKKKASKRHGEDDEEVSDTDSENWEAFLPQDDDDDDVDEEVDEELLDDEFTGSDADADEEGLMDDDEEEDDEDGLLFDGGSSDDEEEDDEEEYSGDDEEGEGVENPLFGLFGDDDEVDDAEEEEDLIHPDELEDEDSDDDGSAEEDEFVDEDNSDDDEAARDTKAAARARREREAEDQVLLPQFRLGTSSLATLESSVITHVEDPWYRKYHLDKHGDVDQSALQPVPIPASALEALKHSDEELIKHAAEQEAAIEKRQRLASQVLPADFVGVRPENVTVAASAHARNFMLHEPFLVSSSNGIGADVKPPYMHEALWDKWVSYRAASGRPVFTPEERGFFDLMQGYPDMMDCTRCWQKTESRRELFVLHLLNHWFKARAVVMAHDKILEAHKKRMKRQRTTAKQSKKGGRGKGGDDKNHNNNNESNHSNEEADGETMLGDEELELRDRGFGKTRLFVMLPMRHAAYMYVTTIVRILGAEPTNCPKLSTFEQDFTEVEESLDPTFKRRPRDYRRQFEGNIDDSFCVGLRLEPHRVHVYAHPLNSDIIICSPLGLRRRLEKSGDVMVSLSSIEVCIVDEAHVLLQQNWQHVTAVMDLLNKRPTETTHGLSDLRRVYAWALEGKSGRHRQTILSSDISNATLLGTFRRSVNNSGKALVQHRETEGVLSKILAPVRQHFLRFDPTSLEHVDDDRFEYFTKQVYATKIHPLVERDVRTIIFVPSYFDFVRLRNYMHREYRESFAAISEYTSIKQQRRALGQFTDLERPVLLVTERFYFFKRYFVKMAEVLVFYSPPSFPEFYGSLVNRLVATSPNAFVMTVFSKYDTHEANRIVGTQRMLQLLERDSGIFSFVTS